MTDHIPPSIRGLLQRTGALAAGLLALASCSGDPVPVFSPDTSPGPAIVDGRIVADFPRVLTSVPWGQPIDDIARFDAVMGGWSYPGAIDEVRAANPRILVFEATSGCEVDFDPAAEPGNTLVSTLPAEWFLTQVGSVLTEPVDSTSTVLEVASTMASDGDTGYELFVAGDALLIGPESVLVTAVDHDANLLTVERGYVRPASAHPAGTRVAAHVMTWPSSWTMNLSTLSPRALGPGSPHEETYAEFNARIGIDLVQGSNVDGIFLDRTDPYVSELLAHDTVRTLDPDQSNTLITDYTLTDETWGEGLRVYESLLREGLGDGKIIYVNRGMANFDLLNGYHTENFPRANGTTYGEVPWSEVMFGSAGYFHWLDEAREPRFTVIQTYQDDLIPPDTAGAAGLDTLQEASSCTDEGFEPDYRMMRFGLTTTLLGDGYFDFEWSTYAQSWKCLFWFDEYDNVGQSTGYLGQPLGEAFHPLGQTERRGAVFTDDVEDAPQGWTAWADSTKGLAIEITGGDDAAQGARALTIETSGIATENWRSAVSSSPFPVESGIRYVLEFDGRADPARKLQVVLQRSSDPWTENGSLGWVRLAPEWTRVRLMGTAITDDTSTLTFRFGDAAGTVWIDDLALTDAPQDVWRRDFEGGIVLVNATDENQTVPLGGTYRKIAGTQDPEVNDGSLVTEVTLPPLDGIILLRME